MGKTFIIKAGQSEILPYQGLNYIEYPSKLKEDWHFHDYVKNIFVNNEIKTLIIPLDLLNDEYSGLRLGMHIRLHQDLLFAEKAVRLIFISNDKTYESIFSDKSLNIFPRNIYSQLLLTTPNVYLEKADPDIIKSIVDLDFEFTQQEYKDRFLNNIKIDQDEKTGKHSIANIWGVIRLAEITGNLKLIERNQKLNKLQKDLYFKYLNALRSDLNNIIFEKKNEENKKVEEPKKFIAASGKNVLFIDDEADNGWNEILRVIFHGANFESVSKDENENYESFIKNAKEKALKVDNNDLPIWDLILLDLRLDKSEDIDANAYKLASEYSGAQLLKEIKNINKGTQVIMFTASNKLWNYRELSENPYFADGYYVKESPELNFERAFSYNNWNIFEIQVNHCFEKKDLRYLYLLINSIEKVLDILDKLFSQFLSSKRKLIRTYLQLAFNPLMNYNSLNKVQALYSFLELYKIIEILGKELIKETSVGAEKVYYIKGKMNKYIEFIKVVNSLTIFSKIKPIKKDNLIYGYEDEEYLPQEDEKYYYTNPSSSLRFSGLMLLRFNFKKSDVEKFIALNNLRNELVAHPTKTLTSEIKIADIIDLAEILKESFNKI